VLSATTLTSTFDSASVLSSCNKGAIYRLWGATLRTAYPTWSGESGACLVDGNVGTAATAWATNPTAAAATYGNIADWNTAAVTSMGQLFTFKSSFNDDISKWNVASVSCMYVMFQGAKAFNVNIGAWNTASVLRMDSVCFLKLHRIPPAGAWNIGHRHHVCHMCAHGSHA
jgi:hypothetical protein